MIPFSQLSIKRLLLPAVMSASIMSSLVAAHDMVPGKASSATLIIQNATVHTITQGTQENYDIVIADGKIKSLGNDLPTPQGAQVIDATGKHVYPGLVALSTTLGMVEVSAVRSTRDTNETGRATPEVKAHIAFNADSEIIPTVRANGIAYAEIAPGGSGLNGQSSVMQLDGWHWQDALVKASSGMHLQWPNVGINKSFWERRPVAKQKADNAKAKQQLDDLFAALKAYHKAREANPKLAIDVRWEAMRPVLQGTTPLYIHANDYRQIEQAIAFSQEHQLKVVIVGARDAALALDLLKQAKVPLVYTAPWGQPRRSDEGYDDLYATPKLLAANNIPYALAIEGSWNVRDLPFAAGQSVAHGVSKEVALRSITIEAAKVLGLDATIGSIEVGKEATLVISRGDIMDHLTHKVEQMFISGREVDLDNRHKQLYRKYDAKAAD